ncbi:hypothetical protein C1645_828657 [Glomus cerebriforme]|uniref:Uncharacterized protein n=1 Tax=Glomus cerebriforme TaxID=658196 RepID=A0A397SS94_9GLOM|nr:hypothetical protein C1645_828657 [Glomus cerebriforme]
MDDVGYENSIPIWNGHVTSKTNKIVSESLGSKFIGKKFSSENFDYYAITNETLCPLCKLGHDDEESIEDCKPRLKRNIKEVKRDECESSSTFVKSVDYKYCGASTGHLADCVAIGLRFTQTTLWIAVCKGMTADDKNSRTIKLFWNKQDITMESEIIDEEAQLQWKKGNLEFERTGLNYLQATSSAVQEKQMLTYKQSTSKFATSTKKVQTKSGNQRLNDRDLNEEFTKFPPSEDNEDNDSSLCQESSSISIDANDNHELNQHQAGYYESASNDNYSKDNVKKRMWKLSTGKYVEEELFNLGKKLKSEHAVHSFILDVDDEIIRHHFSEVELNEIDSVPSPQAPELSDDITDCLTKFAGKEIIKDLMLGNEYDHKKHHDIDYVIFAIYALVREIQSESLKDDNLEAWFNCHIWSVVFDQDFGDFKTISVVRGESASLASGSRKNAERKTTEERRKMGRRGGWILRSITNGDKQEFGAGEAGKHWVDKNGTKLLKEVGLKLPKILKDMLLHLMKKADWNEEQCAKIQTVGLIHAGLMIMTVFLDNPKGYVCRIQRGELMEVPDNVENFPSILIVLASVLNIKVVVQETIKAVQSKEQIVTEFKRAGFRKRSRNENEFQIPPCLSTPKKVKVCTEAYTEKSYPPSPSIILMFWI